MWLIIILVDMMFADVSIGRRGARVGVSSEAVLQKRIERSGATATLH